ncbi:hypothetical protein [Woeseia oceani]|uniref:Uncharacterized protein n=1 Tax=Woeseia oceani TaxID=1548547 RepID=A0A193LC60_9GAMM|nr:hypothetical protein [Woeseia oceani]ANO49984.1 hypothetical protein BA177_00995 [Woeseia oceani]
MPSSETELFDALRLLRDMPLDLIAISDDLTLSDTVNVPFTKTIMHYPALIHVYEQLLQRATVAELDTQSTLIKGNAPFGHLMDHLDELLAAENSFRIDAEILQVIRELRIALFKELRTLSAVSTRTVIDMIVDHRAGSDLGSFRAKKR